MAVNADYRSPQGAKLSIGKRAVEITADAKSKTYGDADPASPSGHRRLAGLEDAFTGSLDREPGQTVGDYNILQGTVALNDNYTLTYKGAKLSIGKRAVAITADAKSKTYGDADPALTFQVTDGSLAFEDAFTGSLDREPGQTVGDYNILQGTVALNDNYTLTYKGAKLSIGKRDLDVSLRRRTTTVTSSSSMGRSSQPQACSTTMTSLPSP